jgi:acyl-CoA dehydrogenase
VRSIYEETLDYAKKRIQGGKPIIEHQHVAMKIAEMKMQVEAARAYLWKSAWSFQAKHDYDPKCGMLVKAFVDHIGVNAVNIGVGVFGGYGTSDDDVPFSKHLRDVYSFLHGFATTEMALLNGAPVD